VGRHYAAAVAVGFARATVGLYDAGVSRRWCEVIVSARHGRASVPRFQGAKPLGKIATFFHAQPERKADMHDLVIRNGTVIDGTGAPRRPADVAIENGRITEIGANVGRGRDEIDASGKIVAPGFIDTHTHDDVALLVEPQMTPKITQGVTTCVCGNCGVSIAPLPGGDLPEPLNLLASTGRPRFVKAADYLDALRDQRAAVNCVPLLGHSSLRATVMGDTSRSARDDEIAEMRDLARAALRGGYHGISTGTFYAAATHATTDEVIAVCAPLSTEGGVFATHMRSEGDDVMRSLDETARIGRALGVTVVVSHHKVAGIANHGRSRETLAFIDDARGRQSFALDCYPYAASSTVLTADRVAGAEKTLITTSEPHPEYAGREVGELATELGMTVEALCAMLHPAGATYFSMSEDDVERILQYPATMIGSDGIPLQEKPHPRLWGTFPRVLAHYCRGRGLFPLETAVHKMTGLTAARFGLKDRGVIAPGMAADITVFDPDTVRDTATFEAPSQAAVGIDCVIVNGRVAWRDGKSHALAGKLLPRNDA
jgi:N-acyl-D-amino-acid deacylase